MNETDILPKHWIKNKNISLSSIRDNSKIKGEFGLGWYNSKSSLCGMSNFKMSSLKSTGGKSNDLKKNSFKKNGISQVA